MPSDVMSPGLAGVIASSIAARGAPAICTAWLGFRSTVQLFVPTVPSPGKINEYGWFVAPLSNNTGTTRSGHPFDIRFAKNVSPVLVIASPVGNVLFGTEMLGEVEVAGFAVAMH